MVWAEDFTMVWRWWEQEALLYCQMRPVKCPEWEWPGVPPTSLSASPEVGERTEVTAPRRVVTGLGLSWSKAAANTAMNSTRWCSYYSEMGLEEETTIISHWSKQIHHSQQLQLRYWKYTDINSRSWTQTKEFLHTLSSLFIDWKVINIGRRRSKSGVG